MKGKLELMFMVCLAASACHAGASTASSNSHDSAASAGDKGTVVDLDGLKSKTPADWKEEKPSNNLRTAQFRVPKMDGDPKDAELVIFHFGKGGGGGTDANLDRWKKKFMTPDGKAVDPKVDKFTVGEVKVTYLDIAGVYKLAPPGSDKYEKLADYRMFGVIFESPNGPYYITLTGPARTLEQQKKGFDEWLKNFK
jgi:hypothetical protein